MSIYAYVRVSTLEQNASRQIIAMQDMKIPTKNIFIDKQSGKNLARPGLQQLLSTVQNGDTIVVESVSRFARNTKDLLELIDKLTTNGVDFISQKEHIDTTTPTGKFMLTVFGAVAELERGYILQRQADGIRAARLQGVKFGRIIITPPENFAAIVKAWESGNISFETALTHTGLKQATFYRRLREHRILKQKKQAIKNSTF